MQLPYILTINPPSLNKANIPIALQAGQKGKIYIYIFKSFLRSNKWLFFPSFLFILLRFKSHQTLYISVSLAHSFNTLLSYSVCLWNLSCHIQCITLSDDSMQHYFERWFLYDVSFRDINFKYWIGYLGVLPQCKSLNC